MFSSELLSLQIRGFLYRGGEKMPAQSKVDKVSILKDKIKEAKAVVFVDYKGITVNEDTELRRKAREAGIEYLVAKNRLFKIALKEAGIDADFDDVLEGTTSFALRYEDGVAPSKLVYDFSKTVKDKFLIKAGYVDGGRVETATIEALAKLPSREELLGQIAYGLLSPVRMLAVAMTNVTEQKESGAEAPAAVSEVKEEVAAEATEAN